ncbi:hypothetical protein GWK08_07890 [Leptobacterium flavescens]|uniref:Uncharacterized protein n=1 Tax=Leptobacterium flavescens TaxID=472055 RepID=A0A6P0UJI0_9FLAO|nr:DUF2007 domain-containing protein [Leptobacterium flavescens]NER13354.1 hypothetical protein [Leptobacterium flavescens]
MDRIKLSLNRIFIGSKENIQLIKTRLEASGIHTVVKDNLRAEDLIAIRKGQSPTNFELFVPADEFEKAEKILIQFVRDRGL